MSLDWLFDISKLSGQTAGFLWIFIRIVTVFSIAPVLGSRLIPPRIRVLFSLLLTVVIFPLVEYPTHTDPLSLRGVLTTLNQVLIGFMAGFILQFVFNALTFAGEHIAVTMGIGFAQTVDPQNDSQVPVVSQFLVVIGILLYISMDGHARFIEYMLNSFKWLPIGVEDINQDALWLVLQWSSIMFSGGVMVSLPAVVALLIVNISMGVMTRAAPQLNIFSVGFPVTILVGLGFLFIWLPGFTPVFSRLIEQGFETLNQMMLGR